MGCCFSSDTDAKKDSGTEPLIPHSDPDSKPTQTGDSGSSSMPPARTDEQAYLSAILREAARNIIDVSATDSQGMEQREYMDKIRQYSLKLVELRNGFSQKRLVPLPTLTCQPPQVLAASLVSRSDLLQVLKMAAYAYSAVLQIRVEAKEELVVQFAIP